MFEDNFQSYFGESDSNFFGDTSNDMIFGEGYGEQAVDSSQFFAEATGFSTEDGEFISEATEFDTTTGDYFTESGEYFEPVSEVKRKTTPYTTTTNMSSAGSKSGSGDGDDMPLGVRYSSDPSKRPNFTGDYNEHGPGTSRMSYSMGMRELGKRKAAEAISNAEATAKRAGHRLRLDDRIEIGLTASQPYEDAAHAAKSQADKTERGMERIMRKHRNDRDVKQKLKGQ